MSIDAILGEALEAINKGDVEETKKHLLTYPGLPINEYISERKNQKTLICQMIDTVRALIQLFHLEHLKNETDPKDKTDIANRLRLLLIQSEKTLMWPENWKRQKAKLMGEIKQKEKELEKLI